MDVAVPVRARRHPGRVGVAHAIAVDRHRGDLVRRADVGELEDRQAPAVLNRREPVLRVVAQRRHDPGRLVGGRGRCNALEVVRGVVCEAPDPSGGIGDRRDVATRVVADRVGLRAVVCMGGHAIARVIRVGVVVRVAVLVLRRHPARVERERVAVLVRQHVAARHVRRERVEDVSRAGVRGAVPHEGVDPPARAPHVDPVAAGAVRVAGDQHDVLRGRLPARQDPVAELARAADHRAPADPEDVVCDDAGRAEEQVVPEDLAGAHVDAHAPARVGAAALALGHHREARHARKRALLGGRRVRPEGVHVRRRERGLLHGQDDRERRDEQSCDRERATLGGLRQVLRHRNLLFPVCARG